MVSFNCKNCGVNKIFDLYENSNVYNIHYICNNCKNGDSNVQMLLSDEIIKDDDSQKKNIIKNKVYNMQIKSNNNNFANFNNNLNQINNFNNIHPINNMNLVGGNPNPMNNMMNNNFIFNNNMMMNNFMFNT
jgi:hypothetical protein